MSFPTRATSNATGTPPAASDGMTRAQGGWNAMPTEARYAAQPTLEEKAWFARLATAAIEAHSSPDLSGGNIHCA